MHNGRLGYDLTIWTIGQLVSIILTSMNESESARKLEKNTLLHLSFTIDCDQFLGCIVLFVPSGVILYS